MLDMPLSISYTLNLFLIFTNSLIAEDGIDSTVKKFVSWPMQESKVPPI